MGFATRVRRVSPKLWFFFRFLRYKYLKGEPEIRALHRFVPRGRMAVDVGSSIGLYSCALARLVPNVVAFEANPAVAAFARRVAPRNVEVINVALSAAAGSARLRIPRNTRGHTIDDLATIEPNNAAVKGDYVVTEVPIKPLDDYGFTDCGFIKIDVEGHEEAVLDGAGRLIEATRPVLMIELYEPHNAGVIARVSARLSRSGYVGYFMRHGELRPLTEFRPEQYQNPGAALTTPPRRGRRIEQLANFIFFPRQVPPL